MKKEARMEMVSLRDIDMGDRARKSYKNIEELAESIQKHGLINPITLLDINSISEEDLSFFQEGILVEDGKEYLLMAGGRRMTAYSEFPELGEEIPARIFDRKLTADELREIELVENIQREDLKWDERADLEREIHELQVKIHGRKRTNDKTGGHSLKDTAALLGKSKTSVSRSVKLSEAMAKLPQLRSAKTQADAEKLLRKLSKVNDNEKRVKKIKKQQESGNINIAKKKLMDSYIIGPESEDLFEAGFFHGVKSLPDSSISFVEIDPPYGIDLAEVKKGSKDTTLGYNEVEASFYEEFLLKTFQECYRVLKPNSWLVCWFGPEPWFGATLSALREAGFKVRGIPGIWTKDRGQTMQPHRYLANSYEMFFYAEKGSPSIYKAGRINDFQFPQVPAPKKIHPTERPVELIEELLLTFTGGSGRVLVPFLGSGNTLLACSNLGMEGLGYDLEPSYRDSFILRVQDGTIGNFKSY